MMKIEIESIAMPIESFHLSTSERVAIAFNRLDIDYERMEKAIGQPLEKPSIVIVDGVEYTRPEK